MSNEQVMKAGGYGIQHPDKESAFFIVHNWKGQVLSHCGSLDEAKAIAGKFVEAFNAGWIACGEKILAEAGVKQ
jgi:hypothetical protein